MIGKVVVILISRKKCLALNHEEQIMKNATITVKLPEPVKTCLDRLAKATHRSRSSLVSSAVEEMLSVEEWQIQGIKDAIQEADSGNMIAHEDIKQQWETRCAHPVDIFPNHGPNSAIVLARWPEISINIIMLR